MRCCQMQQARKTGFPSTATAKQSLTSHRNPAIQFAGFLPFWYRFLAHRIPLMSTKEGASLTVLTKCVPGQTENTPGQHQRPFFTFLPPYGPLVLTKCVPGQTENALSRYYCSCFSVLCLTQ